MLLVSPPRQWGPAAPRLCGDGPEPSGSGGNSTDGREPGHTLQRPVTADGGETVGIRGGLVQIHGTLTAIFASIWVADGLELSRVRILAPVPEDMSKLK